MIRALISGDLVDNPIERTSKNGHPYTLARLSVPQDDEGRVLCSIIAFQDEAVARLLQLKDGATRPSLDLQADEVASTTPRPRKRKAGPENPASEDAFDDLPGSGDLNWPEA